MQKKVWLLLCALLVTTVAFAEGQATTDNAQAKQDAVKRLSQSVKRLRAVRERLASVKDAVVVTNLNGTVDESAAEGSEDNSSDDMTTTPSTTGSNDDLKAQVRSLSEEVTKLKDDIETIMGTLEGINEGNTLTSANVAALQKTKITGYLQAQWMDTEEYPGKTTNDGFMIRRSRLKFAHTFNDYFMGVIQADFGSGTDKTSSFLKDMYIVYSHTPAVETAGLAFTVGQFDVPFSYEKIRSSSEREMVERSTMYRTLLAGERDRGFMVTWGPKPNLTIDAGFFNGLTVEDPQIKGSTYRLLNSQLAFIGRAVWSPIPTMDIGVSALFGDRAGIAAVKGTTTWYDTNGDKIVQTGEVKTSADTPARPPATRELYNIEFRKTSLFGKPGDTIRAEYLWGKDRVPSGPTIAYQSDVQGWYVQYLHDFGTSNTLALRYDAWDPDIHTSNNEVNTFGIAWLHYLSDAIKLTLAWDHPDEPDAQIDNDVITLRAQYKF
jgi:hypothetical protein